MERGLGWLLGREPDPHCDFPAWLFTSSLSLMSCLSCLSLHLDLFMSLFEIMQRTKFFIWPTSPLAGQAPLGEHFLSPRLSFLFCEMGIKSSQHREGEMSVGCTGPALLSAPLALPCGALIIRGGLSLHRGSAGVLPPWVLSLGREVMVVAAEAESGLDVGEELGHSGGPRPSLSLSLSLPDSPPAPRRSMNIEDGARPRLPVPPTAAQ